MAIFDVYKVIIIHNYCARLQLSQPQKAEVSIPAFDTRQITTDKPTILAFSNFFNVFPFMYRCFLSLK